MLTVLTVFFARQKTLSQRPKLVHRFRWGFLFFTLFYIGFFAQGQLSVVNIYTLFLAIWDGFSFNVCLLDPVIFILWVYTFISLFIWGRGLFCRWLCPFGELQEMAAWLGEKLRLCQIKVPDQSARALASPPDFDQVPYSDRLAGHVFLLSYTGGKAGRGGAL